MTLSRLLCSALVATAFASPAFAEDMSTTVPLVPNAALPGSFSAAWGTTHVQAGSFTDTIDFTGGTGGRLASTLASIGFLDSANIDFTSVMVNGHAYDLSRTGGLDLATIGLINVAAPIKITVMGIAAPALAVGTDIAASYGGTVNVSAVPEPETYALMLAGLVTLGFAGRRRKLQ